MTPGDVEDSYPLSPVQEGILFHWLYAPQSGVYVIQLICDSAEDLDVAAFRRAWQQILERHSILRTSFHPEDEPQPRQKVHRQVSLPWDHRDWRGLSVAEQDRRLAAYRKDDRRRGFNISEAPLMRVAVFRLDEARYQWIWTCHHVLLDGRSIRTCVEELFTCYHALRCNRPVALPRARPYRDYIEWSAQQDLSGAEQFWRSALEGINAATPLPVDDVEPQPGGHDTRGARTVRLSRDATSALQAFSKEHELTLNTVLQGAWALLLSRYSGEEDVVFGATRACYFPHGGDESILGLFINTLPVRVKAHPNKLLAPWLREIRSLWIATRKYEHTPLRKIQAWSGMPPGHPLFDSIVVFENYALPSMLRAGERDGDRGQFQLIGRTNYPLALAGHLDSELALQLAYDRSRFEDGTISRMLGNLRTLLEGMAAGPNRPLSEMRYLTDGERRRLLVEWNQTAAPYPDDVCVHQLVEAQVRRTPDAIAAVFEDQSLSYRELNSRANQLANYLRKLGVQPETIVAICLERSLELVIALLGVLKAGGAYAPMDPLLPRERLTFMLQDTGAPVILTQSHLAPILPEHNVRIVCLGSGADATDEPVDDPARDVTPDNIAYVMYTSGSTGRPKGVMVSHRSVCNFLFWRRSYFPLTAADRLLQKASFSFDDSVWEFFEPLMTGARLIMARPGAHGDAEYLARLISEQKVTAVSFVPSMLQSFLDEHGIQACTTLRRVTTGGESLSAELQERFFARFSADLHNLYGPTEATISSTCWTCRRGSKNSKVPIGRPIANTQVYVLDHRRQPAPIGVAGELYIGGDGVSRGYLNRPELTAEHFIPDPFSGRPGARLYRTGDRARYKPDGNLEFLGRLDGQVKIRGFRIELGEVETALNNHPAVRQAVVLAREDIRGRKRLTAYFTTRSGGPVETTSIRSFLKTTLPDYMVPSDVVWMRQMPLTPAGKVDRLSLPAPQRENPAVAPAPAPPRNPVEQLLLEIWMDVLGAPTISIYDNFFELGGDSLSAARVVSRVRNAFATDTPLHCMFERPTIAEFGEIVS